MYVRKCRDFLDCGTSILEQHRLNHLARLEINFLSGAHSNDRELFVKASATSVILSVWVCET